MKLFHLVVHFPKQTVVLLSQWEAGVQILGHGSANAKNGVLASRVPNIGDDPYLFLELLQRHHI